MIGSFQLIIISHNLFILSAFGCKKIVFLNHYAWIFFVTKAMLAIMLICKYYKFMSIHFNALENYIQQPQTMLYPYVYYSVAFGNYNKYSREHKEKNKHLTRCNFRITISRISISNDYLRISKNHENQMLRSIHHLSHKLWANKKRSLNQHAQ